MTIHSRASDLRKRGYTVETKSGGFGSRRVCFYRLVTDALEDASGAGLTPPCPVLAASSSAPVPDVSAAVEADHDHTVSGGSDALLNLFDPPVRGAYTNEEEAA